MGGGGGQKTLAQSAFGGKDKEQNCVKYLHGVKSEIGVQDISSSTSKEKCLKIPKRKSLQSPMKIKIKLSSQKKIWEEKLVLVIQNIFNSK